MRMNDLINEIIENNKIGITFHMSPDGDSIGSALALALGLRKLKKAAYIISKEKIPELFSFLPISAEIDGYTYKPLSDTECVIALDCGSRERLDGEFNIDDRNYTFINIDHHLSNDRYGDLNYVDTDASAVGEIIYDILKGLNIGIDKEIAACLYTSIITDCGSFKYSNTTKRTHVIAGELIATGFQFNDIHRLIFENKKFDRLKLYGKVLDSMYLDLNDKLCVMELNLQMLNDLQMSESDTSDIISLGMEVDCIEVAALFKERENGTRISLRSKHGFDVRKVAEFFGGGGHSKAAGFIINKPITEAKYIVIKHIEKELI